MVEESTKQTIKVSIKKVGGATHELQVDPTMKVLELKQTVEKLYDMPAETQRLVAKGKWESDCGVKGFQMMICLVD